MSKFVYGYHGGGMPDTPEEGEKIMAAWGAWFETLGDALIDPGNPFGDSRTVAADGVVSAGGGSNPLSGYSIVTAADIESALAQARECPILASGGSVEVAEALDM